MLKCLILHIKYSLHQNCVLLNSRQTAEHITSHFLGLPQETTQHKQTVHTTLCLTFTSHKHTNKTLHISLCVVHVCNYSTGTTQLCKLLIRTNHNKHIHLT